MSKLILDNIIYSLQEYGGISLFWKNLTKGLINNLDVKFINYKNSKNPFYYELNKYYKQNEIYNITYNSKLSLFIPRNTKEKIFHSSYYNYSKNSEYNIITVHDFTHEKLNTGSRFNPLLKRNTIKNSDIIVCISESTKIDLINLYHNETIGKKIITIPNGVSKEYRDLNKQRGDFFLFVGSRANYKNFDLFLDTCNKLNTNGIVVAGGEFSKDELIKITSLNVNIKKLSYVSDYELNDIYNKATALLYPSSYEGFGIPIIEAQKSRCPVVILRNPACVETIGDKGLVADSKKEYLDICESLKNNNLNNLNDILSAGFKNSNKYSWEKTSNEYLKLYRDIM